MDTGQLFTILLEVVGGLGIFLLGMKNMSEGVQAVAGPRLRKIIDFATGNRIAAVGSGTFVTCLVQSSSVTTVMVIGLVNVGVMNLMQAFGVIMGANIGTTVTGWILVLKIGKYGLPILGVAAFFYLFSKRERLRYIAMGIMGLGMIFFGLELMKNGFKPLRTMPEFEQWFSAFSPESYWGVLKCCLAGAVLTAIVQSSSATLGITIGLANTGIIDFPTAAALVLGENIGTTVTAYLASLGATVNAKRASYAHILFNVTGVLWITAVFFMYIGVVTAVASAVYGGDPATVEVVDGVETFPYITAGIATVHTGFNVINVLLFLPLMGVVVNFLNRFVPDKSIREPRHLSFFDVRLIDSPTIGIQQSLGEVLMMGEGVEKMMDRLRPLVEKNVIDETAEHKIFHREEVLDVIQKEISEFLGHILSGVVPVEVTEDARGQIRMADEYESISDYIVTVLKLFIKLRKESIEISSQQRKELLDLHDKVDEYIKLINRGVRANQPEVLSKARTRGDAITHMMKESRSNHLERIGTTDTTPFESLTIGDMLSAYRRIKDHVLNIAEVVGGEK